MATRALVRSGLVLVRRTGVQLVFGGAELRTLNKKLEYCKMIQHTKAFNTIVCFQFCGNKRLEELSSVHILLAILRVIKIC